MTFAGLWYTVLAQPVELNESTDELREITDIPEVHDIHFNDHQGYGIDDEEYDNRM